jgi:hypothetical protein
MKLTPHIVCEIAYACRPPCADEIGIIIGFWTGETDTWGKRTIVRVPSGPPVYLFADEITDVRPINSNSI